MDRNYKQALLDELRIIQKTSNKKIHLQSIYFGGGTPSLTPLSTLQEVMHAIYKSNGYFVKSHRFEVKFLGGFNSLLIRKQRIPDDVMQKLPKESFNFCKLTINHILIKAYWQ